jgi:hypothetical protein
MGQTNIQVPIQQRNHDKEVLEKRKVLEGDSRFKPPNPPGGPSSLASDDRHAALALHHNSVSGGNTPAVEAPDMLYLEHTTNAGSSTAGMPHIGNFKQHMSGRRHAGEQYNAGRNVGSTHLQMPAEPHHELHVKEVPPEGGITLPKDQ